ncbi:peptide deformylase [Lentilactobacillus kosonis]|uniref:Peptide deformylase n=1 Tax=Lentilactobacillus kosonis TaxID=2810561 RepID=A0A401FMU4_9LACO|nr:peptide deformylase [Lentilactobacillus kosonis]GAY73699.1 peptide deformylase [Lentilactobacillus kosonis]
MQQQIIKDQAFLTKTSTTATLSDTGHVTDLVDTLTANADRAVGLAANMIGVNKRIIAIQVGIMSIPMINPEIISKNGKYITTEGCLSLLGERQTARYNKIIVRYQDTKFKTHTQEFTDFVAQIIQHEIDHCNGILI